jgi:hypothetical protein
MIEKSKMLKDITFALQIYNMKSIPYKFFVDILM